MGKLIMVITALIIVALLIVLGIIVTIKHIKWCREFDAECEESKKQKDQRDFESWLNRYEPHVYTLTFDDIEFFETRGGIYRHYKIDPPEYEIDKLVMLGRREPVYILTEKRKTVYVGR